MINSSIKQIQFQMTESVADSQNLRSEIAHISQDAKAADLKTKQLTTQLRKVRARAYEQRKVTFADDLSRGAVSESSLGEYIDMELDKPQSDNLPTKTLLNNFFQDISSDCEPLLVESQF